MTSASISVRNLTKIFQSRRSFYETLTGRPSQGVCAVDDISFEVVRGSTFALVGESGSGKSTVAQMVVGLLKPDAGSVQIEGIAAQRGRMDRVALGRRIQMVFQDPYTSLNPRWRVADIIAEPYHALRLPIDKKAIPEAVVDLLKKVGLDGSDTEKYPHEFSGGQRQRIAIARMLAARADIVVCDEPTSALDVSVQAQILNLMRDLQDELGLTYLFISHNLSVVRFMADQVGVLRRGRLVEVGAADELFADPKDAYTRELFAAIPDTESIGGSRFLQTE